MKKYSVATTGLNRGNGNTMLEAIADAMIFDIEKSIDGRFFMQEACDYHFNCYLTKEQLLQLADELKALAES
jgi:hypothetical protein